MTATDRETAALTLLDLIVQALDLDRANALESLFTDSYDEPYIRARSEQAINVTVALVPIESGHTVSSLEAAAEYLRKRMAEQDNDVQALAMERHAKRTAAQSEGGDA